MFHLFGLLYWIALLFAAGLALFLLLLFGYAIYRLVRLWLSSDSFGRLRTVKICIALLAGLVLVISLRWNFARTRGFGAPEKASTTNNNIGPAIVWTGRTILDELECHDKVVQHGIETLSFAEEVNSLFGVTNVDHFISSFGSKTHTPVWNSVTYFGGRYTFTLQVPISIDYGNCKLNGATDSATAYINEVTKVEISTSGIAGARLTGGIGPKRGELSEGEWKHLIKNRGDWSVVNMPILTNGPPIKNFDEYVRQAREPIRNRKEGFDNPIKQTFEALRKRKDNTNVN